MAGLFRGAGGLLVMLLAAGCGGESPRAAVSGAVLFDGEPVAEGTIRFVPADGTIGPMSGGTIRDGRYSVPAEKGPVVGTHRVEVQATRKTGRQFPAIPSNPQSALLDEVEQYIPEIYGSGSNITVEIRPGDNQVDLELESPLPE